MLFVFLYLFFLYIRPQDWVDAIYGLPTATIIIPLGLISGWVSKQKLDGKAYPQAYLLICYIVVIFLCTLVNTDFSEAQFQFVEFLKRILVFYMVVWNVNSISKLKAVLGAVLVLTSFLAIQAILQGVTGTSLGGLTPFPGYDEIRVRWYGDWDGPNVYGILFLVGTGISIGLLFGPKIKLFARGLGGATLLAYFAAIYFTNSRGAILALIVALAYYLKQYVFNVRGIVVGGLAVVTLVAFLPSRMSEVSSDEASAHERVYLWEKGIWMMRDNPIFGVGKGQFFKHNDFNLIAHNNYVQNFAEMGLTGYFIFIALIWFCFKGCYQLETNKLEGAYESRNVGLMLNTSLVAYLAATFFVVMENDLLFFVFGLLTAASQVYLRSEEKLEDVKFTFKDMIFVGAIMVLIYGAVWAAAVKRIV